MTDAVKELRWGCGCHEVDGQLEVQCTQVKPHGDLGASGLAISRPYSPTCFRLRSQEAVAEPVVEILSVCMDTPRTSAASAIAEGATGEAGHGIVDPEPTA